MLLFFKKERINRNRKRRFQNKSAGFTLLEIILVIFLVSTVFVTIYALFSRTIRNDTEHSLEVIAANLAQEGVEIIRNKRDQNVMNDGNIEDDLNEGDCYPDVDENGEPSCDSSGKIKDIQKDGVVYENCPSGGCSEDTRFDRTCEVAYVEDGGDTVALDVSCTVEWVSMAARNQVRDVTVEGYLTDWMVNN
ncbi:MAG: type II secretion system protein [Candidatus Moranbacteria bacterium]|nr:type II secretion system protein [Candidatus Moranbacteria bacterium]